jgi:hypothetical protein
VNFIIRLIKSLLGRKKKRRGTQTLFFTFEMIE